MIILQLVLFCMLFTAMVRYAVRGGALKTYRTIIFLQQADELPRPPAVFMLPDPPGRYVLKACGAALRERQT